MSRDLISNLKESGSSVLLTGHTGFKGIWMTLLLEKLGIEVFGYSLEPDKSSLYYRLGRTGKINEVFDDIRNYNKLKEFISKVQPTFVIHMAAQPLVLDSYDRPKDTFDVNVMGTINLLEISRIIESIKIVGVVTTDKVYKNTGSGRKFIESDQLEGNDPYSASKVATESAVKAWSAIKSTGNNPKIISLRAGNVIGGGDLANNRLIPDIIKGFQLGKKIEIRNSMSTRPWQHVLDPLFGYLAAIEHALHDDDAKAFNFGPSEGSLSVGKVVEIASKILNVEFDLIENGTPQKYESKFLDLDSSLAREKLGWYPTWSQEEAITSTLKWWQKVIVKNVDPFELCLEDIEKRILN
jgi:CDP-glucose 4,6-dehydratase